MRASIDEEVDAYRRDDISHRMADVSSYLKVLVMEGTCYNSWLSNIKLGHLHLGLRAVARYSDIDG